jgi:hypothetical protein
MISRYGFALLIAGALSMASFNARADEPVEAQSPPTLGGCPVFPADNIWNAPVDNLPLDLNSAAYINTIGASDNVHADFGSGVWPPGSTSLIGIPFIVVPSNQALVPINISPYDEESDPGPYPVPANAPIEGAPNTGGDRHVLVVRQGECKLYELYRAFRVGGGSSWNAEAGAVYALTANAPLRPDTWTSADAAGLPILPGLVRYEEVAAGAINHALRFTVPETRKAHIWPARHDASDLTGSQYPPMGQRFRLKANFNISGYSPAAQVILVALKKYGMILADNGSAWYISGSPSESWDNDVLHELDAVVGSDFEAVDVSSLMVNPNSGQVKGFSLSATPSFRHIDAGSSATYQLDLTAAGSFTSTVTLTAAPSPAGPLVNLSPGSLTPPGSVSLTLTDTHPPGQPVPGYWYNVLISATDGGFTQTTTVNLLVGGTVTYLPTILKQP